MSLLLLTLLTFLAGVLAVAGVYSIVSDVFLRDRSRVSKRVDDEFRKRQRDQASKSALFKNLDRLAAEAALPGDGESGLRARFEALVEQADMNLTPRRLLGIMGVVGAVLGLAGALVHSPLAGLALGLLGAAVPLLYVQRRRKARLEKMLAQLPDTFELMARIIRAGQTMSQALQAVADEFDRPISAEFAYCYEQQNLGLPPEVALRDLARRTGLLEIKIFVLGMLVQQQTGGNLAELLEKLSGVVRDRYRIQGKIKALTAEGRMQGLVLLILPVALFLIMLAMNREFTGVLLEYPIILMAIGVSEALGALWIRKIVNFDF